MKKELYHKKIIRLIKVIPFIAFVALILTVEIFQGKLQDTLTLFLSLIVEATPFIVLGVIVSVLVSIFVEENWIIDKLPKNKFISHFFISILGIFMPVCECGNIPVARRLLYKGFSVQHTITFLLAAPIVNPITFFSTREAFRIIDETSSWNMAIIRIVSAIIIANIVGLIIGLHKNPKSLLTNSFNDSCDTENEGAFTSILIKIVKEKDWEKLKSTLSQIYHRSTKIFGDEFFTIMKMLMIGAMVASIFQTFVPRELILGIGNNVFLSIIAMIILSFVISICATVDAFFAASFVNSFTKGSLISFLVFGPMIDIKILSMLSSTFKVKLIILIIILVTLLSILTGLITNLIL